jgi:endonuclease III
VRAVHRRLVEAHGPLERKPARPILDELILTVLSQHTSDVNSGRAFNYLKQRFPHWVQVLDAPVEDVADAIRAGGIADVKAGRIQAILSQIEEREGDLDLSILESLDDDEADTYLQSLPGVGPKTSACVLLFAMNRSAFPIDTHVHRVTARLGWIPQKASADAAHRELRGLVPPALCYELHIGLVRHGRTVCKPRAPWCSGCVLLDFCDAGPRFLAAGEAR